MSYNKEAQKRYYDKHRKKIIKRQTERNKWKWKEYYTEYQKEYHKLYWKYITLPKLLDTN